MMRFWVERYRGGRWHRLAFAESNAVQYCHGFLDACASFYPSEPYRICKRVGPKDFKVLREEKGRGKPHVCRPRSNT